MNAYLNTIFESKTIFNGVLPTFCEDHQYNISTFEESSTADIYEFITEEQISEITDYYHDSDKMTLAHIEEVAPGFAKLINTLNKANYIQIESIYGTIDNYFLDGYSPSYYFFEEWRGMTPEKIIKNIYNGWAYEMENDTVFLR